MEKAERGFVPIVQAKKLRLKEVEAETCSKVPWEVGWVQGLEAFARPPSCPAPTHILSAPLRWMKDEFIIDGKNTWEPVRRWIPLLSWEVFKVVMREGAKENQAAIFPTKNDRMYILLAFSLISSWLLFHKIIPRQVLRAVTKSFEILHEAHLCVHFYIYSYNSPPSLFGLVGKCLLFRLQKKITPDLTLCLIWLLGILFWHSYINSWIAGLKT